jgi:hypothetical protein
MKKEVNNYIKDASKNVDFAHAISRGEKILNTLRVNMSRFRD